MQDLPPQYAPVNTLSVQWGKKGKRKKKNHYQISESNINRKKKLILACEGKEFSQAVNAKREDRKKKQKIMYESKREVEKQTRENKV